MTRSLKDMIARRTGRKARTAPLWKGPTEEGITFSLLSRFLVCRERFRATVCEGLAPADNFNHKIEFGSMWHEAERALASEVRHFGERVGTTAVDDSIDAYRDKLYKKYPMARQDIYRWAETVRAMFPVYVQFWNQHPDVVERTPLEQEKSFTVDVELPSGRSVRLRGKRDAVDKIGKGPGAQVFLQENKTKSRIEEISVRRQLTFDLQTMMYILALVTENDDARRNLGGVRYNVVKRPEHRVGAKESVDEFVRRLKKIVEDDPAKFFMRWRVELSLNDVTRFRRECFDPIMDNLCDWWNQVWRPEGYVGPDYGVPTSQDYRPNLHWRHPFGVYNVLDEGGHSDLDEYLASGSEIGLQRVTDLFPELAS